MIDTLALMTGIDVPIPQLQLVIHQPTCKEIALAGREAYLAGAQCLCIDSISFFQGNSLPQNITNFQIFMTIMTDDRMEKAKQDVITALQLLFPSCSPKFLPRSFGLFNMDTKEMKIIDDNNFNILQEYIKDILCISDKNKDDFNPKDKKAKEIAEKLKRGRQRIAAEKAKENSGDMFTQYLSVITVALSSMSLKDAMELTMFQLYDLVERYSMYSAWDIDIRARMAGADIKKDPDNWMKSIH